MLDSARTLADGGTPVGAGGMSDLAVLRAEEAVMPLDDPWERLCAQGALTEA